MEYFVKFRKMCEEFFHIFSELFLNMCGGSFYGNKMCTVSNKVCNYCVHFQN